MTDFSTYETSITILLSFITFLLTLGIWLMAKIMEKVENTNENLIKSNLKQTTILSDLNHTMEKVAKHETMHSDHYKRIHELENKYISLDCVKEKK